ncbi:MAG: S23 ribosomal protein [Candidatus Berkelbacteria bacterium Athens1014_28]|uniref:S23 ribosomal protein n=1 Tax=Candidatus Berkelbacteria bacterium Athens1014_28 TaxID=2017145 RepID=A0A554LKE8_9BACT|nr:MAG: S23 ribosomal protein [Candidatus Berkelbacteria bacterium Athens1014_28]
MTNDRNRKFDLEERTSKFAEEVIDLCKSAKLTSITKNIIEQLIKAVTSIGANYCEADCSETKKDFEHKIGICKKESRETKFWLRMLAKALPEIKGKTRELWKESNELNLIFCAIVKKSRANG